LKLQLTNSLYNGIDDNTTGDYIFIYYGKKREIVSKYEMTALLDWKIIKLPIISFQFVIFIALIDTFNAKNYEQSVTKQVEYILYNNYNIYKKILYSNFKI